MKVDDHAGSIGGKKSPDQSVDQAAPSARHTPTTTNFSPAIAEISKHLVQQVSTKPFSIGSTSDHLGCTPPPTAKALQDVSLRPITQNRGPLFGTVSLDKLYRSVRQQKLLKTTTKEPLGETTPASQSQFAAGRAGINLALMGNRMNRDTKVDLRHSEQVKSINTDAPLEPQSGQFFSSLIVLNGENQSFEGALFAPSDANAAGVSDAKAYVKQVGHGREMRNFKSQFSLEEGMLVVRRTAGHMQLKKAGIESGLLGATANNPNDRQVLWGGGFKINRARDKEGRLHSWINVSFSSAHLNHRAPDGMVPEEIRPIFRQAMANLSGLPVYEAPQSPINHDAAQTTPENR